MIARLLIEHAIAEEIDPAIAHIGDIQHGFMHERRSHRAARLRGAGALQIAIERRIGMLQRLAQIGDNIITG